MLWCWCGVVVVSVLVPYLVLLVPSTKMDSWLLVKSAVLSTELRDPMSCFVH